MTILGRILVIVNLVFGLVVGALILMVFTKQTNWKANADQWQQAYHVAKADAQTYQDEKDKVREQAAAQVKAANDKLTTAEGQIKELQGKVQTLQVKLTDEQTRSKSVTAVSTGSTAELTRLQGEVTRLRGDLARRESRLVDLEKQSKEFRDRAVAAEIAFKSEHDRLLRALDQIETLAKDLEREKAKGIAAATGVSGGAAVVHPPPEDIEGQVLETDAKTGLLTISIGSDSGVNRGHTLEVYRLKPKGVYVGMIRIVDSRPHEAVARAILPLRAGPIQKGDRVTSNILGRK